MEALLPAIGLLWVSPVAAGLYRVGSLSFGNSVSVVSGERLYVSSGNAVELYDVGSPSATYLVSRVPTTGEGYILTMDLSGDTLFVGTNRGDVVALDFTSPVHPRIIGRVSLADAVLSLRVKDSLIFIANGYNGLRVLRRYDLTTLATLPTSSYATALDYEGDTLFLAATTLPLDVIDVSDPSSPVEIATHTSLPGCSGAIYLKVVRPGEVALRCGDTLKIYDLTDVSSPSYVSTVGELTTQPYFSDTLVAFGSRNTVEVYSVSDPTSPILLGDTTLAALEMVSHVSVSDGFAYVFTMSPLRKFVVVTYGYSVVPYEAKLPGTSSSMVKMGGYLYVYNQGLSVVAVSDPSHPQLLSFEPMGFGTVAYMDMYYPYLYVAGLGGNEVDIYNITVPYSPSPRLSVLLSHDVRCLKALDSVRLFVCSTSGLHYHDLSSSTSSNTGVNARAVDITSDGSYAFAVGTGITSISLPSLTVEDNLPLPGVAYAVKVEGSTAYVLSVSGDSLLLSTVDIGTPSSLSLLGSVYIGRISTSYVAYIPTRLDKAGNYVFGSMAEIGPFVVDVSDPTSPNLVETLAAPRYGVGVIVGEGYVYHLDNLSGLTVFRAPLPTEVVERETEPVRPPFVLYGRTLLSDMEVGIYSAGGRFIHRGRRYVFRRPGIYFVVVKGKGYRAVVK